ncbi:WD40 repeat-like protein [Trichoderma aethiopicum]
MRRFFKGKTNHPDQSPGDKAGDAIRGRKRDHLLSFFDGSSSRSSSRPKSVDGGSQFQTPHNRATSVLAIHALRTASGASEAPDPEQRPDAVDAPITNEPMSQNEVVDTINSPTPQETPIMKGSPGAAVSPQRLWDEAYDKLKSEQPELMEGYETILSNMLSSLQHDPENSSQVTIESNSDSRRAQLLDVIKSSQKKIEREGKVKENIGQVLSVISSLNSTIQAAIQAAPQAALPWSIVSMSLEVIQNPMKEFEENIEGLAYVTTRMDWYWNLAGSLLGGVESVDGSTASNMQGAMCSRLVELYKELLAFQIKSICSFHRNRGLAFLRDMARWDDWASNLQAVRTLETRVQGDYTAYTALEQTNIGRQMRDLLEELVKRQPKELGPQAKQCLQDLHITDPRLDRDRIMSSKGGLLQASYQWLLEDSTVRQWRQEQQKSLLWIKGDPGKGKTMMLCGLSQELENAREGPSLLSYFFCQATIPTLNTATAVLRGLVYLLVIRHPSLLPHLQDDYEKVGDRKLFEGINSWFALLETFKRILQDQLLQNSCFIIDALDECSDRDRLLDLIVESCASTPGVKWILSSRKLRDIEAKLGRCEHSVVVDLEDHNDSTTDSVSKFIDNRLRKLELVEDNPNLQEKLQDIILQKSNRTFLWAALAIEELKNLETYEDEREVLQFLDKMPSGLPELYDRMIAQIKQLASNMDRDRCFRILSTMATTYRPLTLTALPILADLKGNLARPETLRKLIQMCGSFFTIQNQTIYFIHQSAKDYLLQRGNQIIHHDIYSRSVEALESQGGLRANIYALTYPGAKTDQISPPHPDPLEHIQYCCVYWLQHFCDNLEASKAPDTGVIENVYTFLQQHLLHWFEALSLLKSLQTGILSLQRLSKLPIESLPDGRFSNFFQDACRFCIHSRYIMETAPLQVYVSALIFSPRQSEIRRHFQSALSWLKHLPYVDDNWGSCLMTLERHTNTVTSTVFSDNSKLLASSSNDKTIRVWDLTTGDTIHVFGTEQACSVKFSDNCKWLASTSRDQLSVWDIESGNHMYSLDLFAHYGETPLDRLVPFSGYRLDIPIWNTTTGEPVEKLPLSLNELYDTTFSLSSDSTYLAQRKGFDRVQITNHSTRNITHSLQGDIDIIVAMRFSPDARYLALCYRTNRAQIWRITSNEAIPIFERQERVCSIAFSHDSGLICIGYPDGSVKVWNLEDGIELQLYIGHLQPVTWVAFSKDSKLLATASRDSTIKVWPTISGKQELLGKFGWPEHESIALSDDGRLTASGDKRGVIEIWDRLLYRSLEKFELNSEGRYPPALAFSRDCKLLAILGVADAQNLFIDIRTVDGEPKSRILVPSSGKRRFEPRAMSIAFSPDSAFVAVTYLQFHPRTYDFPISIWDIRAGKRVHDTMPPPDDKFFWPYRLHFTETSLYIQDAISFLKWAKEGSEPEEWCSTTERMRHTGDYSGTGYTYDTNSGWITWNGKDAIWLPTDFRPESPMSASYSIFSTTSFEILIESPLWGSLLFGFEKPPADLLDWTPWKSSELFKGGLDQSSDTSA